MPNATVRRPRALVYVRLSVYRGEADASVSPEEQERRCRAYAESKGWEVVDVIRDLDVSASDKGLRLDRPGLLEVRDRLDDTDVVIFAKLDRLARNVVDFRAFADEAAAHGATLVSVAESLDLSTPSGRFVATILASFAEMEAATIADRVRIARGALARLRRFGGGTPPFGYRSAPAKDGPGRVLVVEPAEAAILTEVAERYLAGESFYAIANDLSARGFPTRHGGRWTSGTLTSLFRGGAVVGRLTHRGEVALDPDGLPAEVWPPALDPALWRAVRTRLGPVQPGPGVARGRAAHLLSGLAYCGSCGEVMYGRRYGDKTPIYACSARNRGLTCPRSVSMQVDRLDALVTERYLHVVGDWPAVRIEVAADPAVLARLADTEEALDRVMTDLRDASEDDEARLLTERRVLRAALVDLRAAAALTTDHTVQTGRTVAEEWEASGMLARRELLRAALDSVTVAPSVHGHRFDPSRVTLVWRP